MKSKLRILSLEDNPMDGELIQATLQDEWPHCEVVRVETREAFRAALAQGGFDLILSDNTLPKFEGREALVIARTEYPEVPFIYVSGTIGEEAAIESLRNGAVDYVLKHHLTALVPAVRRALREATERSARRDAEEELRRREERFRSLTESALDLVTILGLDGTFRYQSPSVQRVLGYLPENLLGRCAFEFIHADDLARVQAALQEVVQDPGKAITVEFRFRHQDGTWRDLEAIGKSLVHAPEVAGLVVNSRDVTPRKRAEEALRRSEEQVRRLIDSSLDMIIAVDEHCNITEFNPAAQTVFGYRKEEVLGRPVDLLYADPEEGHRVHDHTVVNGHCLREIVNRRKNGEPFPSVLAASVLLDDRGTLAGVMGISRDITKAKQAEEKLRQQQRLQQSILDTLPVGVWFMDARRTLQLVNPADYSIWTGGTGVPPERGKDFKLWQANLMQQVIKERWGIVRALTEGHATSQEAHSVVCFDGQARHILHSAVPLFDEAQRVQGALAINQDVTQSVLAHQQIRSQAELLDKARDAILVCDLERRIRYWNESAERLYGWTAKEAVGQDATGLLFADPPENLAAAEQRLLDQGEWVGEMTHQNKHGGTVIVESRWTLVRDEAGQPKAKLVINTDVTEKKQIESQFLRAQRLESIGMLASGLAHDLNNVLAPIMMSVPLLREQLKDPFALQTVDTLESSAQRGASLVEQILSFARGKEGERKQLQLKHLIRDIEKVVKQTFPKSIRFHFKISADLWPVEANPTQIHQVLLNLCVNARDAMPQGGRLTLSAENVVLDELQAQAFPSLQPGNYVVLQVADTGIGIPRDIRDKIFLPFFTTKTEGHGSGLGLPTALGIVKNHSGHLGMVSAEDQGTTFSVYLPAVSQKVETVLAAAPPSSPKGNGETILIAEDERGVREVIIALLTRNGYRVLAAEEGTAAVAIFAQHQDVIDLVMTDVNMPYMDGAALIRSLRKMKPEVKIAVMTGLADNFTSVQFSSGRPIPILRKPFNSASLLTAVHDALHSPAP